MIQKKQNLIEQYVVEIQNISESLIKWLYVMQKLPDLTLFLPKAKKVLIDIYSWHKLIIETK